MNPESLCPGRIYVHERMVQIWRFHGTAVDDNHRESLVFTRFPSASAGSILHTIASAQFVTQLVPWENSEEGLERLESLRQLFKTLGLGEREVLLSQAFSDIVHSLPDQEAYALWMLQQSREQWFSQKHFGNVSLK
jgi:hypothetical protein